MTLSAKSSVILEENKAGLHRESHIYSLFIDEKGGLIRLKEFMFRHCIKAILIGRI